MVACSFLGQMFYWIGVLLAVFSMSMSNSVVVREGQSVQMNCSPSVNESGYTSFIWVKQTNHTPPVCVLTINYYSKEPVYHDRTVTSEKDSRELIFAKYHNGYNSTNVNWTFNKLTSASALAIKNVSVSDSGLYYCGKNVDGCMHAFSVTILTVTASVEESNAELTETKDNGQFCSGECGTVVLVLGVLSAVLNVVLVILILTKHRGGQNTASGQQASSSPDQVQDSMNYAALNFSGKRKKRSNSNLQTDNPHVIYAATR